MWNCRGDKSFAAVMLEHSGQKRFTFLLSFSHLSYLLVLFPHMRATTTTTPRM
jgi:hypothetical protein